MALTAGLLMQGTPAAAAPSVRVDVTQLTGAAPFNSDDIAGHDSSASNDIVRTNDLITYRFSVAAVEQRAANPVLTFTLPVGQQIFTATQSVPPQFRTLSAQPVLPSFCQAGSSVTPALADPPALITPTSKNSLQAQTVTCRLPEIGTETASAYSFVTMVRPEMQQGDVMTLNGATLTADGVPTATSSTLTQTVSSAHKLNFSINNATPDENEGFIKQGGVEACSVPALAGQLCFVAGYTVTISIPDAGKGGQALPNGALNYQINVDPTTSWNNPANSNFDSAKATDLARYGGYLGVCDETNYQAPNPNVTGTSATTTNSARKSGTTTCSQPGGPGTPIKVSVTGMDSSAFTTPTDALAPAGFKLDTTQGYIYSKRIFVQWPIHGIFDFGTDDAGVSKSKVTATISAPDLPVSNVPGSNRAMDSYRTANANLGSTLAAKNFWTGVPVAPTTTTPTVFSPGYPSWYGPSGPAGINSGDGVAVAGQRVLSTVELEGQNLRNLGGATTLSCVAIDPTKAALANYVVPSAQPGTAGQQFHGNDGAFGQTGPVWISGSMYNYASSNAGAATAAYQPFDQRFGEVKVQYSPNADTTCAGNGGDWYDSPAAVPGNDATPGIYTGVKAIRVMVQAKPNTVTLTPYQRISVAIATRVTTTQVGDLIPTQVGYVARPGLVPFADMVAIPEDSWVGTNYDPQANNLQLQPRRGDRLTLVQGMGRMDKTVLNTATGQYLGTDQWTPALQQWGRSLNVTPPTVSAGNEVTFRLRPSLRADTTATYTQRVKIEECLPKGMVYVGATLGGQVIVPELTGSDGNAQGATINCAAGFTYVRFDLGDRTINQPIPILDIIGRVLETTPSGTHTNVAATIADQDVSRLDQRMDKATINVVNPGGFRVSKAALVPVVNVAPNGWTSSPTLGWQVQVALLTTTGETVSDVDVIDVLPANGSDGSTFSGSGDFVSVSAPDGIRVLYTKNTATEVDATAASNTATGSTLWCDAPSGGNPVSGAGTAAECPANPADVTALRFQHQGTFTASDAFSVVINTSATGNNGGEVMVNQVAARADGISVLVGPTRANTQFRTTDQFGIGTITGKVWTDTNGDGIYADGEPVLANQTVTLTGTNSEGQTVNLTTTTDDNGNYRFTQLFEGDYTVSFQTPPGTVPTKVVAPTTANPVTSQGTSVPVKITTTDFTKTANSGFTASELAVTKSVTNTTDATRPARAGDVLKYTVVVENKGPGDRTTAVPAWLVDDLTKVLDDATYNNDAIATNSGATVGTPTLSGNQLRWSGPIPAGDKVEITYTVTVKEGGDKAATNVAFVPTATPEPDQPVTPPTTCAAPTCATTTTDIQSVGMISGTVWDDTNRDGTLGAGEQPLGGVIVVITDGTGKTVATLTTDDQGKYTSPDLPPGTYTVTFTAPDGYQYNKIGDSVGQSGPATIDANGSDAVVDTGLVKVGSVGGVAWHDLNGDGIRDDNEPVLGGVTVTVNGPDGKTVATVTTNADGSYLVPNLVPGNYTVVFTTLDGYLPMGGGQSSAPVATISVVGGEEARADAGYVKLGKATGIVWEDKDGDGVRDEGEGPLSGVTVTVTDEDGNTHQVTTGADGTWTVDDLPPGTYTVVVTPLPGTVVTVGGNTTITIEPTGNTAEVSTGLAKERGSLTGHVWNDLDNDGVKDDDEPALPGVTVIITDKDGNETSVVTDQDGNYTVPGLAPGDYTIRFVPPAGFTVTIGTDSFGESGTVTVKAGEVTEVDAGMHKPGEPTPPPSDSPSETPSDLPTTKKPMVLPNTGD